MDNKSLNILILQKDAYRQALLDVREVFCNVIDRKIKHYDDDIAALTAKVTPEYRTCEHSGVTFEVSNKDAPVDTGE